MKSLSEVLKAAIVGLLVMVICFYSPVFAIEQTPNVRMQWTGESGAGLFEPVYATFSVENNTTKAIQFDLGLNRKDAFEFSITSPDGAIHQTGKLQHDPDGAFGAIGNVSIAPGQTYSQRLLLNEWYDFPTSGTYTVRLTTNLAFQAPDPITVTIGAKNEQHLRDLCSALATQALSYIPPHEEQSDAALALSHIRDPIAVPFLQQILESGSSAAQDAAEGLGRIGSSGHAPAIDVLNTSLGRADVERRSYIVGALLHAHHRTTNEDIKSRIEVVLPQLKGH